MFVRNDVKELFPEAVRRNEIFDFLIGGKNYEIRLNEAYMPTDTRLASRQISEYLKINPSFDTSIILQALIEISKSPDWGWLLVYYVDAFWEEGLLFISFVDLINNIKTHRNELLKNKGWICYNFGEQCPNLWEVVKYEILKLKEKGYVLPDISKW